MQPYSVQGYWSWVVFESSYVHRQVTDLALNWVRPHELVLAMLISRSTTNLLVVSKSDALHAMVSFSHLGDVLPTAALSVCPGQTIHPSSQTMIEYEAVSMQTMLQQHEDNACHCSVG